MLKFSKINKYTLNTQMGELELPYKNESLNPILAAQA